MALRIELEAMPGVNLTPMIDIVFQLVTFFMLTLDLSHKELSALELPRAHNGTVDTPALIKAERRIVFNVLPSGDVQCRGVTYGLSSALPAEQARALASLRQAVASIVRLHPRLSDGSADVDVFVRADRASAWRRVQWLLQTLGDPSIQALRVTFSVEGDPVPKGR
jgi:biopolymer transport protein ExbD